MLLIRPRPLLDESLRGYLFRVSQANGLPDIKTIFALAHDNSLDEVKALGVLLNHHAYVPNLAGIVPKSDGSRGNLQNTRGLSVRFWNTSRARFCPDCLAESPHLKAVWELTFVVACPKHQVRLIDICSDCKKPIRWVREKLDSCACGEGIKSMITEPADANTLDLASILAKLLGGELEAGFPPHLKALNLEDFSKLIWFLGGYAVRHNDAKPLKFDGIYRLEIAEPLVQAAGDILLEWPQGFHQLLHQLGSFEDSANQSSDKLQRQFGFFYHSLYRNFSADRFAFLHQAFEEFLKAHWKGALNRRNRRFSKELLESHTMVPLPKIAKELKLSRTTIQWLVQQGKLNGSIQTLPSGRSVLAIDRASVQAYQHERQSLIGFNEARKILNLGKRRFRELIQAGMVKAETGPIVDGRSAWGFTRGVIEQLVNSPEKLTIPDPINLNTENLISIPEVAMRLGIKQEVAYHIAKHGYLVTIPYPRKRANTVAVTEEGLQNFQNTYVTGAELAKMMGISPRYLKPEMELRGIYPCFGPEVEGCRQYFYRRI